MIKVMYLISVLHFKTPIIYF